MELKTLLTIAVAVLFGVTPFNVWAQSAGTGALAGTVLDSSGAVVPDAKVMATNNGTGESRTTVSGPEGTFRLQLLPPGLYGLRVEKSGFKTIQLSNIAVSVTEVAQVRVRLDVGAITERIEVSATEQLVQTESSAQGRIVSEQALTDLPLVTRNYTQILGLSPGIVADVTNAGDLGRGNGGLVGSEGGVHVNGARAIDNNFQMNGLGINDLAGMGSLTGGVAIPNPDTIQEFKVQTSQYDASFGRNAGGNVDIVTKSGTNNFHGTLFEFYRDKALNANDFFSNLAGQPKAALHQNQFGGTIGGPIRRDKLFFFASYQGTRQKNGVAATCSSSLLLPPLTNDRSAAAIGALFAGQRGLFQNAFGRVGPAVAANGSNINPVSLNLLQLKLPNGQFLIPNPQSIDASRPTAVRGFSVFHDPCSFSEDQALGDIDYIHSDKSRIAAHYFFADSSQTVTFPGGAISNQVQTGLPGSPSSQPERFQVLSFSHTYIISPHMINEAKFGYHRTTVTVNQQNPFTFSSVGANTSSFYDSLPSIYISGCCQIGGAGNQTSIQNIFQWTDSLSYVHGKHNLRFGGGIVRNYDDVQNFRFQGTNLYPTWPDFLLGLNGAQNGTHVFSNILVSIDFLGLPDRAFRTWDGFGYVQDDWKVAPRLTLNLGFRYERIGELGDELGRNGNFDPALANQNPPAAGTLQGYTVPSNFSGTVPDGVTRRDNNLGIAGVGQNTLGPRFGLAWQMLPNSSRLVLRGGYGIYYTRPVGQATFQLETDPPFGLLRVCAATCNGTASAGQPFGAFTPAISSFPLFQPYSPDTNLTIIELAQDYRPPITQQYSLGIQADLSHNLLFEIGYVGTRGTHIIRARGLNQALLASASNPIRGETTNTFDNIAQRLPYVGFSSGEEGVRQLETAGAMWYNGLQASLTKRFSNGLQFLASYTFSKTLDTDGVDPETLTAGGSNTGNQNDPSSRYGPSLFSRDHRFVFSYVYELPSPKNLRDLKGMFLGGWSVSGVTTLQTGQHLTITGRNTLNVFGITNDRVQLAPGCAPAGLTGSGSVTSRLNNYFNASCIATDSNGDFAWPVVGSDGIATGFGNSGVGIATGPGQFNFDMAISKRIQLRETMNVILRAELFNAFNTPQFSNPGSDTSSGNFGVITGTSVNPRIMQLAVKFSF
ncbi:MAG: carboxypeptidase-like regulatory domain-containing protein [Acidobacteriia bacterium]|nr:carboxypeptidase-like regulatory domain-containing protein [Terriglobia bacterium]